MNENTLLERIMENNNLNDFIFELANEVYNRVPEDEDFYNHIPIFNIQQALSFVIVIIDTLNKEFSTNTSVENLITEISKNENKIDEIANKIQLKYIKDVEDNIKSEPNVWKYLYIKSITSTNYYYLCIKKSAKIVIEYLYNKLINE